VRADPSCTLLEEISMAGHSFRPSEEVIWLKNTGGGFVVSVLARIDASQPPAGFLKSV
jgi:hypothetical protein